MTINHTSAVEELQSAWEALRTQWLELGELWNDTVHERFAREHWAPLEKQTVAAGQALGELLRVLAAAHRNMP